MNIENLRQKLYANSPHNLGSLADDTYRDAVDRALDEELPDSNPL